MIVSLLTGPQRIFSSAMYVSKSINKDTIISTHKPKQMGYQHFASDISANQCIYMTHTILKGSHLESVVKKREKNPDPKPTKQKKTSKEWFLKSQ